MLRTTRRAVSLSVFLAGLSLAAFAALAAGPALALELPVLWQAQTDSWITGAATLTDLDGDGRLDVLTAGVSGITATSADGKRLWKFEGAKRVESSVSVLERPGQSPLVYVGCYAYAGDTQGPLVCVDSRGQLVWQARLGGGVNWSAPSICDLTGDGRFEVVQGDQSKHVTAFDAESGEKRWETAIPGEVDASMAVADLDGDGNMEVIIPSTSGEMVVLNSDGTVRWQTKIVEALYSAPVVFTASSGGKRIVCGSGDAVVVCLDASGKVLWKRQVDSSMDASVSAGDIDQDGRADIFVVTEGGRIWRFDEDGKPLWELLMGARCDAPGSIADVTGDGRLEYVLCTHTGRLLVLDANAKVLLDESLTQSAYNATPAVGNVSGKDARELVISGGGTGLVFCLETPSRAGQPVEWGSFRADPRMTGEWKGRVATASVSVAPPDDLNAADLLSSTRYLSFTVSSVSPEPEKEGLQATVGCLQPDGLHSVATAPLNGKETSVSLPISLFTPGVYRFHWQVEDKSGVAVVSGGREIDVQPFANDVRLLESLQQRLEAAAGSVEKVLPLSARALRERLPGLTKQEERTRFIAESLPDASPEERSKAAEEVGAYEGEAKRLRQAAVLIAQATDLGPTTSLLLSAGELWNNFGIGEMCPAKAETQLSLERRCVADEHEPIALNLFNVTDRPLRVQIFAERSQPGPAVRLMHVVPVPAGDGSTSWDAMPELDESRVISVPPLATEQVWVDIDAAGLAPGDYSVTVRCLALNGAGVHEATTAFYLVVPAPVSEAKIALKVLDFRAAPASSFHHCNWAYVSGSLLRDYPEATYQDLLAHGTNVFVTNGGPKASFDDDGRLVGAIDFSTVDADIARFRGQDVIFLMQGMVQLTSASGKQTEGSEAYKRALVPYLDALVKHMAEMGFSTKNFAYYPFDEPGSDGWPTVNIFIEKAKLVREADPRIRIYVDGGPPAIEMYEAMLPYVDIWQSYLHRVWNTFDDERVALIRRYVKEVWTYDMGVEGKTQDLVDYYLADPIYCFVHGLTGNGYWTYCTQQQDPWQRGTQEYVMVYPGTTKPVTSRRWEAVRESIEDYRILTALRSLVQEAEAKGVGPEACAQARQLMDVELPAEIRRAPLTEKAIESMRAKALAAGEALTSALRGN